MVDRLLLAAAIALSAGSASAAPVVRLSHAAPAMRMVPLIRVLDDRVTRTTDLPTAELRRLRRRMIAEQWISFQDMRRLADHGDGLAAFEYGQRLLALDDPALRSDAALYFATAAYAGRDYAVYKLVELLKQRDVLFSEGRLVHLENAMRSLAAQGSDRAVKALIRFYETGHPFGFHPERARSLLGEMADVDDSDAAMKLATRALSGNAPEITRARIEGLLEIAMTSDKLGTRVAAESLLGQVRTGTAGLEQTAKADPQ